MSQTSRSNDKNNQEAHENQADHHAEGEPENGNEDVNLDAKDMMHEGAPPPEQVDPDIEPETLDESVTIEVEAADSESDSESGAAAGETPEDPIEALRAELAATQAKADEYLDKMQRTAAEYQNSRRRQEKQMTEEIERANGQLIKRLLPVLDDFYLAFDNVPAHLRGASEEPNGEAPVANPDAANDGAQASATSWISGFRQIQKKLVDTLREQGLEMIDTAGPFDPALHEAISSEPHDTIESGHIIETVRAGYVYKGQVIRPALIRVAA